MKKSNIKKDILWNSIGSFIQAFNSLFFMVIVTRINGIEVAGYFSYAFVISNIFLVVASFGGRGFQITDAKNEFSDNLYKRFRIITTIVSLVLFMSLFLLFKYPSYKYLVIILLIMTKAFESISDVYYGILQKNNELSKVGKSLFFKSILSVSLFLIIEILFKNLYLAIVSWIVVDILFLVFYDRRKSLIYKENKKENNDYIKILKTISFFFGFAFLSAFLANIPRYFVDGFLTDKMQGIFGILIMPATMISLLTTFILQPFSVKLSNLNKDSLTEFKKLSLKIFTYISLISFACIVISYLIGIPILNLTYGINLDGYRIHLLLVMVGAYFLAVNSFLSLIYTIKRKLKYQFTIYLISAIISCIISYFLVKNFGFMGGIISYLFTMAEVMILYIIRLGVINKE